MVENASNSDKDHELLEVNTVAIELRKTGIDVASLDS
jgi:hypothetical protein